MTATVAMATMAQRSPNLLRFILQFSTSIHVEFLGQLQVVSTPVSRPSDVLLSIDTAFVTIETVEVRTANGSSIRAVFINPLWLPQCGHGYSLVVTLKRNGVGLAMMLPPQRVIG